MLKIRPVWKADELKRFGELEEKYHYMGETHSGGDTLRLVIEDDGEWVAIMVWGGACYHLLRRDEYIGWTPSLRARRLKLIASNRRFTILAKPGERRNLASQCLALAAREIPGLWMRKFHYRPLLAETFCDIEHSAGTCYKAAGWTPLGMTKGFTRTNRQECDFYVPNDRPKTLWVKPLVPDALEVLNARELPEDCALGAQGNSDGVMPIGKAQRESLYDALCRVRDTRDSNRTFHIGTRSRPSRASRRDSTCRSAGSCACRTRRTRRVSSRSTSTRSRATWRCTTSSGRWTSTTSPGSSPSGCPRRRGRFRGSSRSTGSSSRRSLASCRW